MHIITVASQKGGVGKTTMSLNLGLALARAGNRTLLMELDAQGSLWQGHARLVLSAGAGSRDAIALPGQVHWSLRPHGLGLKLDLSSDCCSQGATQILIQPGWRQTDLHVQGAEGAEARWQLPSSLLAGLGKNAGVWVFFVFLFVAAAFGWTSVTVTPDPLGRVDQNGNAIYDATMQRPWLLFVAMLWRAISPAGQNPASGWLGR